MVQLFNSIGPTNELGLLEHQIQFDTSTVLGTTLRETVATNPVTQLWRWNELSRARSAPSEQTDPLADFSLTVPRVRSGRSPRSNIGEPDTISEEEQLEAIKELNLEGKLTAVEGETQEGLALRVKWKKEELARAYVLSRSDGDVSTMVAQFGVGLFGSLLDPLNVAAGFVPVIGVARYSRMLQQQASALGRTATRVKVGAAEGVVGAALIEPALLLATEATQYDYDIYDSFANLAFGSVLGGGMHGLAGAVRDLSGRTYSGLPGMESGLRRQDAPVDAPQPEVAPPTRSPESLANQRISAAVEQISETDRRHNINAALSMVMSGKQVNGLDTMLRKSLEETYTVTSGPTPNRNVIVDPFDVRLQNEPSLANGKSIRVTASEGQNVQTSYRDIAVAEKKAKQLEKKGFIAKVRSLGEDDHRIDLDIENNFVRHPDGEYAIYRNLETAEYAAKSNKNPDTDLHVVRIGDEFLLYEVQTNAQTAFGIRNALDASANEIQMPLEVPVVRSELSPEAQGPTIQEQAQQDVRDVHSDDTNFGEMQERELAAEVDRIMENIIETTDVPQIETQIAELEAQIETMKAEAGDDLEARQFLDEATAGLQKTRESQKAWEEAAVCVLGGLT
tara:strand:- start:16044 stop:17906 length:1863 start_codon:yes stop_codon:yes gene_type:complete